MSRESQQVAESAQWEDLVVIEEEMREVIFLSQVKDPVGGVEITLLLGSK